MLMFFFGWQLRFYGVIQAFREGRMPNNQQIDETLRYVNDHSFVDVDKLSPEGQKLIQDVRDIIETSRQMVMEKNADELFQNFVWHTSGVDVDRAKQNPNDLVPVDKSKAQADGQQAVKHLRTLFTLVLTNSEARKLLADFAYIGRDLFAHGAAKVAESARPPRDRMDRVDEPAPRDQFVTEGGRKVDANSGETPVLEANIPNPMPGREDGWTVKQHPHNEFGTGAEIHGPGPDGRNVRTGAEARDHAVDQGTDVANQGLSRAQEEANQLKAEADATDDPNEKKDIAKGGIRGRFNDMKVFFLNYYTVFQFL